MKKSEQLLAAVKTFQVANRRLEDIAKASDADPALGFIVGTMYQAMRAWERQLQGVYEKVKEAEDKRIVVM